MRTAIGKASALAVMTAVLTTAAIAQSQNPPAQSVPGNPAINTEGRTQPNAPVSGANSFTEGQAKSRIEASGYNQVSGLQKDGHGVWRGKAMKDGKTVDVSLDFQGNVIAR